MTPKPAAKANLNHQKILAALVETKPVSWTHKRIDPASADPRKPEVISTKVTGTELRFPLARNVSEFNVERAARRWSPNAKEAA